MTKYKANDVVHVRLDEDDARCLNMPEQCEAHQWGHQIIAHIPAPEPVSAKRAPACLKEKVKVK